METLKIGQKCVFDGTTGTIKFIGKTKFASGDWVGVELEKPVGRNSGIINQVKYFECTKKCGIFVRPSIILYQKKKNLPSLEDPKINKRLKLHKNILNRVKEQRKTKLNKIQQLEKILESKGEKGQKVLANFRKWEKKRLLRQEFKRKQLELQMKTEKNKKLKTALTMSSQRLESNKENKFELMLEQLEKEKTDSKFQLRNAKKKTGISEKKRAVYQIKLSDLQNSNERKIRNFKKINAKKQFQLKALELNIKKLEKELETGVMLPKLYVQEYLDEMEKLTKERKMIQQKISMIKTSGHLVRTTEGEEIEYFNQFQSKKNWIPKVFDKHPKLLVMRERLRPLTKVISFSRLVTAERAKGIRGFESNSIYQGIMNYYRGENKPEIVKSIETQTGIPFQPKIINTVFPGFAEAPLRSLLRFSLRDPQQIKKIMNNERTSNLDEMQQQKQQGRGNKGKANTDPFKLAKDDLSIWSEPEDNEKNIQLDNEMINNGISHNKNLLHTIVNANINKLIERLTWDKGSDPEYTKSILITYPRWISVHHFLQKIIQTYNGPSEFEQLHINKAKNSNIRLIRMRIISLLKIWIEKYWDSSIPNEVNEKMKAFIETVVVQDSSKESKNLLGLLERAINLNNNKELRVANIERALRETMDNVYDEPPPYPKHPKNIFASVFTIDDLCPLEFARQITLFCYDIFIKIRPSELITCGWSNKREKHEIAPNTLQMCAKFNDIAFYFTESILMPLKLSDRIKAHERILDLGDAFLDLKNYDGVMMALAACGESSIARLKKTKNGLSNYHLDISEEMDEVCSSSGNFSGLRNIYQNHDGALIPYFGMMLTDLTFMSDGSPDVVDGKVNFSKMKLMYTTINQIQKFQSIPYNLQKIQQVYQILEKPLQTKTPIECYQISLEREPRKK
ncbi:guanine nucleotide exchange factor [Anaeramoeba flamelloides]|uniref:Guanine nucleotide exchange factor n=1 Tax=Anaeramoeba flamelloides TaxID=1746091 RepID=A0AAV7Y5E8_9EUKA|nr:guanine nucleotide exchange factor [Anaeramoeba flamelloides]